MAEKHQNNITYPRNTCYNSRMTSEANNLGEIQLGELHLMGWIQVTDIGEENLYFKDQKGNTFFVKCL